MHNNNPTETFFRNLQLELDRNPELNLELQAENHDDDYQEQEYPNIENFLTFKQQSLRCSSRDADQIKPPILKEEKLQKPNLFNLLIASKDVEILQSNRAKANSPIRDKPEILQLNEATHPTRQQSDRKSYGFLKYIYTKKFINKISKNRENIKSFNETHYEIIGDKSSDKQVLKEFIKIKRQDQSKHRTDRQLFNLETPKHTEPIKLSWFLSTQLSLKKYYANLKTWIWNQIEKVPLIQPESKEKIWWDYVATFARAILLIMIPLEISFHPHILFKEAIPLTIIQVVILILDLLIRLNTVCYLQGNAVNERWLIFTSQFKKSVILDCIAILPLLYFLIISNDELGYPVLLVFCLQFRYIIRVINVTEESAHLSKSSQGIVSLIQLIITLLYIGHLFSCVWFYNSINDANLGNPTWITHGGLLHSQWSYQYIDAFYYSIVTMLTIGYGDIVPQNTKEKLLAIVFILFACIWFSYAINAIGNIIKEITQSMENRKLKMRLINRYMKNRKIPFSLQYKIREYLNFCWKHEEEQDMNQENVLINQLSEQLKDELAVHTNGILIKNCDFLQQRFSQRFLDQLSTIIRRIIVYPENRFNIQFDSKENHLCFLEEGQLMSQIETPNKEIPLTQVIETGSYLNIRHFILDSKPDQYYKAIGCASLLTISKSNFLSVLSQYPHDYQNYCSIKDSLQFDVSVERFDSCPLCKKTCHSFFKCPLIKYIPDKELVVKRHLYSNKQQRKPFIRPSKRKNNQYNALLDKDILNDFLQYFQLENKQQIDTYNVFMIEDEPGSNQTLTVERQKEKSKILFTNDQIRLRQPSINEHDQNVQDTSKEVFIKQDSVHQVSAIEESYKLIVQVPTGQSSTINPIRKNQVRKESLFLRISSMGSNTKLSTIKSTNLQPDDMSKQNTQKVEEFNSNFAQSILQIYKRLQYSDDLQIQNEKQQIEDLKFKLECRFFIFDTFDRVKNFDNYQIQSNFSTMIPDKGYVQFLDYQNGYNKLWSKLNQYISFPSMYIQLYKKKLRNSIQQVLPQRPMTKNNIIRMNQIKNIFFQKKNQKIVPDKQMRNSFQQPVTLGFGELSNQVQENQKRENFQQTKPQV